METERKPFDCVAMKRDASSRIYEMTKGMTKEQELDFWRQRAEHFRQVHPLIRDTANKQQ